MVDINSLSQFFSSNEALAVFGFLGEYLAGKTLDKLSEAKTVQLTSKEFLSRQLLESLEDALRATCNEYGWIYDENAISATFSAGKNIWLGINSTERLISVLGYAIGNDYSNLITEDVAQFWIDAFDIEVAFRQELHNYLHSKKNDQEQDQQQVHPPIHLLPRIPPATLSFVKGSRDAELAVLTHAVTSGEPVYIWGLGGMGKTQVAIQLAKNMHVQKGAYFLHYVLPLGGEGEAMRETILQAHFSGYRFQGIDNAQRDAEYLERMDILRNEYSGALLIIDNFDWPGKSLSDLQAESAFQDLTRTGVKLVFTTRYAVEMAQWKIGAISDEALLELIRKFYNNPAVIDEQLLELIHAVKGHTLMVDLMAKTLARSRGRITPQNLLGALQENNLHQEDYPDVPSDRNAEHSQRQIYAHLRALFSLSNLCEEEQAVLSCATLLPEDGMDYNLFRDLLLDEHMKALDCLVDAGWLQCTNYLLLIHPVIREVCRTELHPTQDDPSINFLLDLLVIDIAIIEARGVSEIEQIRQFAKLATIVAEQFASSDWAVRAGSLWSKVAMLQGEDDYKNQRKGYEEALECHLKALDIHKQKSSLKDETSEWMREYATILYNLGTTYCVLGDYQNALGYGLDALKIRKKELPTDDTTLAASYSAVGHVYRLIGKNKKALDYKLQALVIMEKNLSITDLKLGEFYDIVGETYNAMSDYRNALIYGMKALTIFTYLCSEIDPKLTTLNQKIISLTNEQRSNRTRIESGQSALSAYTQVIPDGDAFLDKFYDASLHLCKRESINGEGKNENIKALRVFERVYSSGHPKLIPFYENLVKIFIHNEELEKACEYQLKVLGVFENMPMQDTYKLVDAYNFTARLYNRTNKHEKELEFRLKALGVKEKQTPLDKVGLAQAYDATACTYEAMEKIDEEIAYRLKALPLWEQVRPKHPLLARSYLWLGTAYMSTGEYENALLYYAHALAIQEERLSPNHVDRGLSYFYIGVANACKQNWNLSSEYLERAVTIWERTWSSNHPYVERANKLIAEISQRLSDWEMDFN